LLVDQLEDHYDNGLKHGKELRTEVRFQIEEWEKGITRELSIDRDSMMRVIYVHSGFLAAIQNYTPELLEELNGIADGAQLDRELVLAFNLGEEIYNFCTANFESCSNLGVSTEEVNYLAYNQDLPQFLHGKQKPVILKLPESYVFTMPGSVGLSGVSKNFAVSCNSLPMLKMNRQGLPLSFFLRKLLTLKSLNEAEAFIRETPLAIGQNLMLASKTGIANFEISNSEVKSLIPSEAGIVFHTNFPIENDELKRDDYSDFQCDRYEFLIKEVSGYSQVGDWSETLENTFSTEPVFNLDTYLRFVASYSFESEPKVTFINPKSGETLNLLF
ncbi:MAG: C45 family autoproteolytic acyltransferase/hydrolase, partial [Bacteroidota bacterium]